MDDSLRNAEREDAEQQTPDSEEKVARLRERIGESAALARPRLVAELATVLSAKLSDKPTCSTVEKAVGKAREIVNLAYEASPEDLALEIERQLDEEHSRVLKSLSIMSSPGFFGLEPRVLRPPEGS